MNRRADTSPRGQCGARPRRRASAGGSPSGVVPMPILLTCQCGKKLRVADESRGKKVRCPECQALVVAEPGAAAPPPAPAKVPRDGTDDEALRKPPKPTKDDAGDEDRPARKPRKADPDEDEEKA